ncbi:MAG: metallophosphoesterase [Oscillospiraceae bacterium]|nr:metallophosphoesterase [Oscillospiraceae bacterium]
MLRIFMTGDNHIGLKYASHEKAAELIAARIDAFDGMVEKADENNCDLFVITGDLFDNNYGISKHDIAAVLNKLSAFRGTVVVLPGNHDYYDKDAKLWKYFADMVKDKDNILLLTDYRPYRIPINDEEAILYPALCTSLHSAPGENKLGWIKEENIKPDSVYRLGIAHGAVEGETIDKEGLYFLMKRSESESIPVDAWLIGHTHVPFPKNLKEESFVEGERIFNAGTHVQTDVSCNTEGCCFIIEIESGTGLKNVRAKKIISGGIRFYRRQIAVSAGETENIVMRELSDIPDNSVVDIILKGAVSGEEYENRRVIAEKALARFIEGTYNDSELSKLITSDLIAKEFPETSFSAEFLNSLSDNPKEAQLAYELLKSIKEAG